MSAGSLAADARAELAAVVPERRCDRLAELSALFHTAGTVHLLGRGKLSFHLDVAESSVARRAFAILRARRVESEIRTYHQHAFERSARTGASLCPVAMSSVPRSHDGPHAGTGEDPTLAG